MCPFQVPFRTEFPPHLLEYSGLRQAGAAPRADTAELQRVAVALPENKGVHAPHDKRGRLWYKNE